MANDIADVERTSSDTPTTNGKAATYWFDDGSVIARLRDCNFKVHKGLLDRHSPYLKSLPTQTGDDGVSVVHIPEERATRADFETLLEHLYHDLYAHIYSQVHGTELISSRL